MHDVSIATHNMSTVPKVHEIFLQNHVMIKRRRSIEVEKIDCSYLQLLDKMAFNCLLPAELVDRF